MLGSGGLFKFLNNIYSVASLSPTKYGAKDKKAVSITRQPFFVNPLYFYWRFFIPSPFLLLQDLLPVDVEQEYLPL